VRSANGAVTLRGGQGNDTLRLGSIDLAAANGQLAGLRGPVSASGDEGADTLELDNSGDTAARSGTLTGTGLSGFGLASPLSYASVETLRLNLGAGADRLDINGTHAGQTTLDSGAGNDTVTVTAANTGVLTINAGAGNDTVNVRASQAPITVNGGAGDDSFNLTTPGGGIGCAAGTTPIGPGTPSGGTLNKLAGQLSIDGGAGKDTLFLDDTGDTAANTGTLGADSITGFGMGQGVAYGALEVVSVKLGMGADKVTISGTHAGQTWLDSGAGDDTITLTAANAGELRIGANAGDDTVNLRASRALLVVSGGLGNDFISLGSKAPGLGGRANVLAGPITVTGDGGFDVMHVDDSGNPVATAARICGNTITGLGMAQGITFASMEWVVVTPARPHCLAAIPYWISAANAIDWGNQYLDVQPVPAPAVKAAVNWIEAFLNPLLSAAGQAANATHGPRASSTPPAGIFL